MSDDAWPDGKSALSLGEASLYLKTDESFDEEANAVTRVEKCPL
jgi:hypothetical protein